MATNVTLDILMERKGPITRHIQGARRHTPPPPTQQAEPEVGSYTVGTIYIRTILCHLYSYSHPFGESMMPTYTGLGVELSPEAWAIG